MMREESRALARRIGRGECPVACGKWGSAEAKRATEVGKGPHLTSQSDSSLLTACWRAIVQDPFEYGRGEDTSQLNRVPRWYQPEAIRAGYSGGARGPSETCGTKGPARVCVEPRVPPPPPAARRYDLGPRVPCASVPGRLDEADFRSLSRGSRLGGEEPGRGGGCTAIALGSRTWSRRECRGRGFGILPGRREQQNVVIRSRRPEQ
ncbi:hypothetical protein KM043_010656 [Ampulex compressa]|nr:hypothetical protein KM043_010656 [Ampulex compressa]